MMNFDEALAILVANARMLGAESVALAAAHGRVAAADVCAAIDQPRARVSTMDGYAVQRADLESGIRTFTVVGHAFPGAPTTTPVGPGEAVRLFTGAPLPPPTDHVVIQEQAEVDGDLVTLDMPAGSPAYIRERGSDCAAGAVVVAAGTCFDPGTIAAAAAADVATVLVARQPRVAMLATGDELVPAGTAAATPHKVPDSLSAALAALVTRCGATMVAQAHGGDTPEQLTALAAAMVADADVLIVTGGASVGERDFAMAMAMPLGLSLLFSKVAIKPGKPVWLGRIGATWVIGLPGNPTSALVTARLFVVPLIAALLGQVRPDPLLWRVMPLADALAATGDRETFVRAAWVADGLLPLANQDSGAQAPLADAQWLIRCPAHQPARAAGDTVSATLLWPG